MTEKETLKEKWEKSDKKVIIAVAAGFLVGAIFVKAHVSVEIKMAGSDGYARGTRDVLRTLMSNSQD